MTKFERIYLRSMLMVVPCCMAFNAALCISESQPWFGVCVCLTLVAILINSFTMEIIPREPE